MPNPNERTAADVEAELASIDAALQQKAVDDVAGDTAGSANQQQQQAPGNDSRDYEYEARRKGWKPQDQYTGPEGKWVDAKTFVERGDKFTAKLQGEIETLKQQIASFEGTKAQFRKFFDDQMEKRDKEHAEAIAALRIQRSAATREGDDELAIELEDRIETMQKQRKALKDEAQGAADDRAAETPAKGDAKPDPVLLEWIEEGNSWFRDDETLAAHAVAVARQFRKDGEKAMGRAFIEKVAAQVKSDFPRRFRQMEANGERPVATGGSQSSAGAGSQNGYNGKTERDLPAEDLALMRQFIKDGLYTKEQFLKSYFGRNK